MEFEKEAQQCFNNIDYDEKSFLTVEDILFFFNREFVNKVDRLLTLTAVNEVCKSEICRKNQFKDVLILMEELKYIEENAYWEFQLLDSRGSGRLRVSEALTLARVIKGKTFSLFSWNQWEKERINKTSQISWEDFRKFLYFTPGDVSEVTDNQFEEIEKNNLQIEEERDLESYKFFKNAFEDIEQNKILIERQNYKKEVHYHSKRLLNKWNHVGIEPVINDDKSECDIAALKDVISINDILDGLAEKYNLLRQKVLWEMVNYQNELDSSIFSRAASSELIQKFQENVALEAEYRNKTSLKTNHFEFHGKSLSYNENIFSLMGDFNDIEDRKRKDSSIPAEDILLEINLREKDEEKLLLKSMQNIESINTRRLFHFVLLYQQILLLKKQQAPKTFSSTASGVSLTELHQLNKDLLPDIWQRLVTYSSEEIKRIKKLVKTKIENDDSVQSFSTDQTLGVVDNWLEVTRILVKKYELERRMLVKCSLEEDKEIKKLKKNDKILRYNQLHKLLLDPSSHKKENYFKLLNQSTTLLLERLISNDGTNTDTICIAMAKLINIQNKQLTTIFESLKSKNSFDLYEIRQTQIRLINEERFENFIQILFEDEPSIKNILQNSVELKYNVIRAKLFCEFASKKSNSNITLKEYIENMKEYEINCRQDSNKQNKLLNRLEVKLNLKEMFGPSISWFSSQAARLHNSSTNEVINEIDSIENMNLFEYLVKLYKDELNLLNHGDDQIEKEILKQKWIAVRVSASSCFHSSAIDCGLLQRTWISNKLRLREDNNRYIITTQQKVVQDNLLQNDLNLFLATKLSSLNRNLSSYKLDAEIYDDINLKMIIHHQTQEWKFLQDLLKDPSADELREVVQSSLTFDEQIKRLKEINRKKDNINFTAADWREDLLTLLDEACAIKVVCRRNILKRLSDEEESFTDEDIFISLLADLQQEQDSNLKIWFNRSLEFGNLQMKMDQYFSRFTNIFEIVCKYESLVKDDDLIKELESKFDAIREKLLAEALLKQHGRAEWLRLSDQERQNQLAKLKLEEKKLRLEGNIEGLKKLLGEKFINDTRINSLLGDSRKKFHEKLRAKLEARKKNSKLSSIEEENEDDEVNGSNNPLIDLSQRFEEEKEELLQMLKGTEEKFMNEKERQDLMLSLKQAKIKAQNEEKYQAAALVSGLVSRECKQENKLKSDKQKQLMLAKKRLNELKKKSHLNVILEEDEISKDATRSDIEESIIKIINKILQWERDSLGLLLIQSSDPVEEMKPTGDIMELLNSAHSTLPNKIVKLNEENSDVISDLLVYRMIHYSSLLENKEEISATILAELQEVQDQFELEASKAFSQMDSRQLLEEHKRFIGLLNERFTINIIPTLLSSPFSKNEEVEDALQAKKSVIIDAIVEKVLEKKTLNWNSLSDDDKFQRCNSLSSKVKKKMNEKKFDEAFQVLTAGLDANDKTEIISELSDNFSLKLEDYLKKLEEEKARQIESGISIEEAHSVFEKEKKEFIEKEKRKNILENLELDVEAERAKLTALFASSINQFDEEQKRQIAIAKLRKEQKQMKKEKDLFMIYEIFALSNQQDNNFHKERSRQLRLAENRFKMYKKKKEDTMNEESDDSKLDVTSDVDISILNQIFLQEVDQNHQKEVETLIQLMNNAQDENKFRIKAQKMSKEDRSERVRDLRELRHRWRVDPINHHISNQLDIFLEAAALQLEELTSDEKAEEDARKELLANLQEEQDRDLSALLISLQSADTKEKVVKLIEDQKESFKSERFDNVANTLLGLSYVENDENIEVVKELEDKFEILKDKLLSQALIQKFGESEWMKIAEEERQRRITQIKIKERKLRLEGKEEEIQKLFEHLSIREGDIEKLFAEKRTLQKKDVEERLGRRLQDKSDDASCAEEKRATHKPNILLLLDRNLDKERKLLLERLRKQDEMMNDERRKQFEIAKLKRQQRQLQQEEKYNQIELILQLSKQQEYSIQRSRDRQIALAKERLKERRNLDKNKKALKTLLGFPENISRISRLFSQVSQGSSVDRLVLEIERKHKEEQTTLMLLFQITDDSHRQEELSKMDDEDLRKYLEKFLINRKKWREERLVVAMKDKSSNKDLSDPSKRRLVDMLISQNKLLIQAFETKLEERRRASGGCNTEDIYTGWLAELQENEEKEISVTLESIINKDDDLIDVLREEHQRARRECWNDTIGKVVFGLPLPGQEGLSLDGSTRYMEDSTDQNEEEEVRTEINEQMRLLDEEVEEFNKDLDRKELLGVDIEEAKRKFYAQIEAKKRVLKEDSKRQREQILQKIRERKEQKYENDYEAHAAAGMVYLAEKRLQQKQNLKIQDFNRQKTLIKEKLKLRREKRIQMKENNSEEKVDPVRVEASPFSAMRREKTVIDIKVSDEERAKLMDNIRGLVYQQMKAEEKERKKQQEKIKQRKEQAQEKSVTRQARTLVADQIKQEVLIEERQKTRIERERTMLGNRLTRLKSGKTLTPSERRQKNLDSFAKFTQADEVEGLNEEEKMKKYADNLQRKLTEEKEKLNKKKSFEIGNESESIKSESRHEPDEEISSSRPITPSRHLSDQDKVNILRQRSLRRKKEKKQQKDS